MTDAILSARPGSVRALGSAGFGSKIRAVGRIAAILQVAVCGWAVVGCGAGGPPRSATTQTPTPAHPSSPSPSPSAHYAVVTIHGDDSTVYFVRDDGVVLGKHIFKSLTDNVASTTAAGRFWYIARADGHLHSVDPSGNDADVAALPDAAGQPATSVSGLAVSPDGSQWAWGVTQGGGAGTGQTRIDIGGTGVVIRYALEQMTSNPVLQPIAWTSQGILVARRMTGIGGCCYLTPEYGATDAILLDPTTLAATSTWAGCSTASASTSGSFACAGATVVVHRGASSETNVSASPPISRVGWTVVDDARNRVLFGVIHSQGQGGATGPYVIDTEAGDLRSGVVTKLFDESTPDAVLPDGSLIVTSAPPAFDYQKMSVLIQSTSGAVTQLGPVGSEFRGLVELPS